MSGIIFESKPAELMHGMACTVRIPGRAPRVWDPTLPPTNNDLHRAHIATHLAVDGLGVEEGEDWWTVDASLVHDYEQWGGSVLDGYYRQSWRAADGCIITIYREAFWRRGYG